MHLAGRFRAFDDFFPCDQPIALRNAGLSTWWYAKSYEVIVLDNLSPQIHGENLEYTSPLYRRIKDCVRFIQGGLTDRNDWLRALEGIDAVIHLAAETGTGQSMYEIEKYTVVNIGETSLMGTLDIQGDGAAVGAGSVGGKGGISFDQEWGNSSHLSPQGTAPFLQTVS